MLNIEDITSITAQIKAVPFNKYNTFIYVFTVGTNSNTKCIVCGTTDREFYDSYGKLGVAHDRATEFFNEASQMEKELKLITSRTLPVEWLLEESDPMFNSTFCVWDILTDVPLCRVKLNKALKLFFNLASGVVNTVGTPFITGSQILERSGLYMRSDWVVSDEETHTGFIYAKHPSGVVAAVRECEQELYAIRVSMPQSIFGALVETDDDYEKMLQKIVADIVMLDESDVIGIRITPYELTHDENVVSSEDILLEFDVLPFLVTNSTKPIRFEKVDVVRVSSVADMLASVAMRKHSLGVLLDFDNPIQALEFSDAARDESIDVYAIHSTDSGTYIVKPVPKRRTTRSDR